jgi:hypothetical protein
MENTYGTFSHHTTFLNKRLKTNMQHRIKESFKDNFLLSKVIVVFVDIGGIVDHHCLKYHSKKGAMLPLKTCTIKICLIMSCMICLFIHYVKIMRNYGRIEMRKYI